jgi:hypothetical protein
MSSACSRGSGHMRIIGTDSLITDKQISAVAASTRAGSHGAMFGKELVAGFGIPVWLAGGCI